VEKAEKGICVEMDPKVLKKLCEGFLKNAIENTPDDGKIEIELKAKDPMARLDFRDFEIGITPENQKLIFSGFFHIQETDFYASKKPRRKPGRCLLICSTGRSFQSPSISL